VKHKQRLCGLRNREDDDCIDDYDDDNDDDDDDDNDDDDGDGEKNDSVKVGFMECFPPNSKAERGGGLIVCAHEREANKTTDRQTERERDSKQMGIALLSKWSASLSP